MVYCNWGLLFVFSSDGCVNGWYGNTCDLECSLDCLNKTCQLDGHCIEGCLDPLKLGDFCNMTCNLTFPGCKTCRIEGGQFECNDTCSAGCEICGPPCTKCQRGLWLGGTECYNCSMRVTYCVACSGVNDCTECQPGYFGHKCEKCPGHCLEFESETNCSKCETGWQGTKCQCGPNCKQNGTGVEDWCADDGKCTAGCLDGKMADNCQGNCTEYCERCNQDNGKCELCKAGHYDIFDQCHKKCGHCMDNKCDIDDGLCVTECKNGYHGPRCNMTCGENCEPNICDKASGECEKCKKGYHGKSCENTCNPNCNGSCIKPTGSCVDCKDGFWGDKCERNCSAGCRMNQCDKVGECIHGCKEGMFGEFCNKNCSVNCLLSCDPGSGYCHDCTPSRYGLFCNESCSTNCGPRLVGDPVTCQQNSGRCDFCKQGLYGDLCDYNCPKTCARPIMVMKTTFCVRQDGSCSQCLPGNYGQFCTDTCSNNCKLGTCNQKSGACDMECAAGWYDDKCELACNEGCKDGLCHRYTAKCLSGCRERFSGERCENGT